MNPITKTLQRLQDYQGTQAEGVKTVLTAKAEASQMVRNVEEKWRKAIKGLEGRCSAQGALLKEAAAEIEALKRLQKTHEAEQSVRWGLTLALALTLTLTLTLIGG